VADVAEQVWGLVAPYVAAEGIELDDVEILGGGRLLRVVIEGDGPIELDRIADISRGIARIIEREDPFPGSSRDRSHRERTVGEPSRCRRRLYLTWLLTS